MSIGNKDQDLKYTVISVTVQAAVHGFASGTLNSTIPHHTKGSRHGAHDPHGDFEAFITQVLIIIELSNLMDGLITRQLITFPRSNVKRSRSRSQGDHARFLKISAKTSRDLK